MDSDHKSESDGGAPITSTEIDDVYADENEVGEIVDVEEAEETQIFEQQSDDPNQDYNFELKTSDLSMIDVTDPVLDGSSDQLLDVVDQSPIPADAVPMASIDYDDSKLQEYDHEDEMIDIEVPHTRNESNVSNISHSSPRLASRLSNASVNQIWINRLQTTIDDLQSQIQGLHNQNASLQMDLRQQKIDYETKLEQNHYDLQYANNKAREYRERFKDLQEQFDELRTSQLNQDRNEKEKKEFYLQLREAREINIQLRIDLDSKSEQTGQLQKRVRESSGQVKKLNLALIQMQKSKSILDKAVLNYEDKIEYLEQETAMIVDQLDLKIFRLTKERDYWKDQCEKTETEKMRMQNEITEATLNLISEQMDDHQTQKSGSTLQQMRFSLQQQDYPGSPNSPHHTRYHSDTIDDVLGNGHGAHHFIIKNRVGSQISLPDNSLLDDIDEAQAAEHSRNQSIDSELTHRQHSRDLSGSLGFFNSTKFKQELLDDLKTVISQEMTELKTAHKAMAEDDEKSGSKLDEDSMQQMMKSFERSLQANLDAMVRKQEQSSSVNIGAEVDRCIQQIGNKINDKEGMQQILEEAVENQMGALQYSLEEQITQSISQTVQNIITESVNDRFRVDMKSDVNRELDPVKDTLAKIQDLFESKEAEDGKNQAVMHEIVEKFQELFEKQMSENMTGKIDSFMTDFRLEVVPELTAIFENLRGGSSSDSELDEVKVDESRHGLKAEIKHLKSEIEQLKQDNIVLESTVSEVAKSKVNAVLRIQNLVDHMRYDNRMLYARIEQLKKQKPRRLLTIPGASSVASTFSSYLWGNDRGNAMIST